MPLSKINIIFWRSWTLWTESRSEFFVRGFISLWTYRVLKITNRLD